MKKPEPPKPTTIDQSDIAVALSYRDGKTPKVTAKGRGAVAQSIIETAELAGVPRLPEPELAPVLAQIPLGEDIPEALYRAVAEVIAFAYIISGKIPEGFLRDAPEQ